MIVGEEKPDLTEELVHFGVKGMKWGHHKPDGGGSGVPSRQDLKKLDKANRAKENVKRDATIESARNRYANNARVDYLKAKAQYKVDKRTIGKVAARKKFDAVKIKNQTDFEIASQAKSGKETTHAVLAVVGSVLVAGLLGAAANR